MEQKNTEVVEKMEVVEAEQSKISRTASRKFIPYREYLEKFLQKNEKEFESWILGYRQDVKIWLNYFLAKKVEAYCQEARIEKRRIISEFKSFMRKFNKIRNNYLFPELEANGVEEVVRLAFEKHLADNFKMWQTYIDECIKDAQHSN